MTCHPHSLTGENGDHLLQEHCHLIEIHYAFLLVVDAIRQLEYRILGYLEIRQTRTGHDVFDDQQHSPLLHLQRQPRQSFHPEVANLQSGLLMLTCEQFFPQEVLHILQELRLSPLGYMSC